MVQSFQLNPSSLVNFSAVQIASFIQNQEETGKKVLHVCRGLNDAPQIPAGFQSFLWILEELILAETSAKITILGVTQNVPRNAQEWNAQESGLRNIH